jgi:hypothetical protein
MADNYRHLKAEGGAADEFTLDSAVRTVLAHLQTGEKETGFLAAKILETESRYTAPDGPSGGEIDGLYDRGFRLYNVVDSEDHDTCSRLSLYDYGRTPEAFLADLCGRAMVVGSSATASIPSALANYDLLYLESRLGDLFRRLGTDELDRLREAFERTTEGYGNLRILPEFIGAEGTEGTLDLLSRLYGDEEAARHWMEKFACAAAEKDENGEEKSSWYGPARYARALAAWKRFYDSPCCPAFLCLFSRLCKAGDPDFDLALLREAAAMLSGISAEEAENMMVLLSGDAFEEQKETILSDLSAGGAPLRPVLLQNGGRGTEPPVPAPRRGIPGVHRRRRTLLRGGLERNLPRQARQPSREHLPEWRPHGGNVRLVHLPARISAPGRSPLTENLPDETPAGLRQVHRRQTPAESGRQDQSL